MDSAATARTSPGLCSVSSIRRAPKIMAKTASTAAVPAVTEVLGFSVPVSIDSDMVRERSCSAI